MLNDLKAANFNATITIKAQYISSYQLFGKNIICANLYYMTFRITFQKFSTKTKIFSTIFTNKKIFSKNLYFLSMCVRKFIASDVPNNQVEKLLNI